MEQFKYTSIGAIGTLLIVFFAMPMFEATSSVVVNAVCPPAEVVYKVDTVLVDLAQIQREERYKNWQIPARYKTVQLQNNKWVARASIGGQWMNLHCVRAEDGCTMTGEPGSSRLKFDTRAEAIKTIWQFEERLQAIQVKG